MISDIQKRIIELKKEKDICILAHSYQAHDIIEVADYTGDSFQLSLMAQKSPAKTVLMCGVRFMAETVKILSPEKRVILVSPSAGCPMAEQFSPEELKKIQNDNPGYSTAAYINTTAALKALCDVCVTSSSAVKIVEKYPNDKIIFIPDCNLGQYVKDNVKNKTIKLFNGGCPIHASVTSEDLNNAKSLHPNALVLVHPECKPDITAHADYIGSTADIMKFAKKSSEKEFIIGTEISICEHLKIECPDKRFYPLSKKLICPDMKLTSIVDVYNTIIGADGEIIELDQETISNASTCINEMLRLG